MKPREYVLTWRETVWESQKPVGSYWIVNEKTGRVTFYDKDGNKDSYTAEVGMLYTNIRSNETTFPERNFNYKAYPMEVLNV